LLQIDDDLLGWQSDSLGDRFDDAAVGLVRNEEIEIGRRDAMTLEQPPANLAALPDRELEDGLSVLLDVVHALLDALVRGRHLAAARGHAQRRSAGTIDL